MIGAALALLIVIVSIQRDSGDREKRDSKIEWLGNAEAGLEAQLSKEEPCH